MLLYSFAFRVWLLFSETEYSLNKILTSLLNRHFWILKVLPDYFISIIYEIENRIGMLQLLIWC